MHFMPYNLINWFYMHTNLCACVHEELHTFSTWGSTCWFIGKQERRASQCVCVCMCACECVCMIHIHRRGWKDEEGEGREWRRGAVTLSLVSSMNPGSSVVAWWLGWLPSRLSQVQGGSSCLYTCCTFVNCVRVCVVIIGGGARWVLISLKDIRHDFS